MSKLKKIRLMNFKFLLMCVSVLSLVLIGCTESEEKGEEKNDNESSKAISLSIRETLSLNVGEAYSLVLEIDPDGIYEVKWESEDTSIATVSDEGIVTGITPGVTNITAIVEDQIASCKLTIKEIESITINLDDYSSAETVAQIIRDADARMIGKYILKGDYSNLNLGENLDPYVDNNVFVGIRNVKEIDFSAVTGWPIMKYSYWDGEKKGMIEMNLKGVPNFFLSGEYYSYTLEKIILPDEVMLIGRSAFDGCHKLKEITAQNVQVIDARAFDGCAFSTVEFPQLRIILGRSALFSKNLSTVILPKVTRITGSVFDKANVSLLKLTAPGNININESDSYLFSKTCTLYLNQDKKAGGTGAPTVVDGNKWGGFTWKEIIFVND